MKCVPLTDTRYSEPDWLRIRLDCEGADAGMIEIRRKKRLWKVMWVHVDAGHRRSGLGTKLYEAAARAACDRGGLLVSSERCTDAHSNAFWRKQARKGRARIVKLKGFDQPIYVLTSCSNLDLSRVRLSR